MGRRGAAGLPVVVTVLLSVLLSGCSVFGGDDGAEPARAEGPVTRSVGPAEGFSVDLPGVATLSGGAGSVSAAGSVTLAAAGEPPATASGLPPSGWDGFTFAPGVDVSFSGAAPAGPLTLALAAPARPAGATASPSSSASPDASPDGTPTGTLVPVVVHLADDGSLDLLDATVDAQGRFVVRTDAFSPSWPAWLDPRRFFASAFDSMTDALIGRTDPLPCANDGPTWAELTKKTTLVHTCLITNKDAKGVVRAEAQLQTNRRFWLKTSVPEGSAYTWSAPEDTLLSARLAKALGTPANERWLLPDSRITAGYVRPPEDLTGTFTTFQDAYTVSASVVFSFVTTFVTDDAGAGWAAAWGLVNCADEIPRSAGDADQLWHFLLCFLTDGLPQLSSSQRAFDEAVALLGESAYTAEAQKSLLRTAKGLKFAGLVAKYIGPAAVVRDIWQQIPDAFSAMGNDRTGDVVLTLDAAPVPRPEECDDTVTTARVCRFVDAVLSNDLSRLTDSERTVAREVRGQYNGLPARYRVGECEALGDITAACPVVFGGGDVTLTLMLQPTGGTFDFATGIYVVDPGKTLGSKVVGWEP